MDRILRAPLPHRLPAPQAARMVPARAVRVAGPGIQPIHGPAITSIPGLGELGVDPGAMEDLGLPAQDMINALYDIFGAYPRKNVLPYFYSFSLTVAQGNQLSALGTQRPSIKVSSDAAFIARYITGASTGEYTSFMRMDSSDRQLMQFPIHSAAMVGTAERPFPLPKPLLIAPNTTISFDITDLSNAENEVYFTLCGFKVYRRQYAAAG